MEEAHSKNVEEVLDFFSVSQRNGLTNQQVQEAQEHYGRNELAPDEGTPFWKLVLKQFDDLLVKILIIAAVVDLVIAFGSGETGLKALVEPGVIVLILLANAAVGVVTESKAEKAIEDLKAYEADSATVLREGKLLVVPSAELVPGDIVEVSVGGKVPADIRVLEILSSTLGVDQSILTGESGGVTKTAEAVSIQAVAQDKTCILFSGTMVTTGRCRGIVVGTGQGTAIGKIRDAMAESVEEMTPLKKKLDEFGTFLSKVIAGICVLVWVMNIRHFNDPIHGGMVKGAIYYFKIAVALAVAAIPEGLPAVVTTCLALGTRKMAQKSAIVRRLPSVETLGCTTVICSDKTGTLTTNNMSVCRIGVVGTRNVLQEYEVTGTTFAPEGLILNVNGVVLTQPADSQCLGHLAMCSAVCNNAAVVYKADSDVHQGVGESTEVALRVLVEKIGLPGYVMPPQGLKALSKQDRVAFCNSHWQEKYPLISTLEFSNERKMMSVLCSVGEEVYMFVKGAPESVLPCCRRTISEGEGGAEPLTAEIYRDTLQKVTEWGSTLALRSLALAYKRVPSSKTQITAEDENDMTFIGLVGMHDPPRPEACEAIAACRAAGIRVIMVTGDNPSTAEAISKEIGIVDDTQFPGTVDSTSAKPVTGVEFDNLSTAEQHRMVRDMAVFARVEPGHKSKLVDILKSEGEVVAVTGDGVNDAPALKRADIGVSMGSGTAVARHASDMVLADDNFATIVHAVKEGRAIYNNTRQFIRYMVSSNIGEVVAIFAAALLGIPETLNPVQLLWVNLVTDGLPATALGFNKPDKDIMRQQPRRMNDPVVGGWMFFRYLVIGIYVGVATVMGFIWWYLYAADGPHISWHDLRTFQNCVEGQQSYSCSIFRDKRPSTMSVSILVMVEMFNALNALSENASLFQLPPWSNMLLLGAIALSILLHMFILYFQPATVLFSVTGLGWQEWGEVLWLSFPVIIIDEVLKMVTRRLINNKGSGLNVRKWKMGSELGYSALEKGY